MRLRTRLLVGMALVAAVLAVVAVVITATTRNQLIGAIDTRLASFSPGDGPRPDYDRGDRPQPPQGMPERPSDVFMGYIGDDGVLETEFVPNIGDDEYDAPDIDPEDLPAAGSRTFTTDSASGSVTYRVLAQTGDGNTTITALPLDDVQRTISRLVLVEVVGSLAILATLGVVSWWVVHLGIRPVKEMTETAGRIAAGDVDVRVPESAPGTESGDLAVALNTMLGHLAGALDESAASEARLRRFVADASHELRTPVTTIRGYAELYRLGGLRDQAALDDAMRRTEQEAARHGTPRRGHAVVGQARRAAPARRRTCRPRGARPRRRCRRPGGGARAADHRRRRGGGGRRRRRRGPPAPGDRQRRRQRPRAHRPGSARHHPPPPRRHDGDAVGGRPRRTACPPRWPNG